MARMTVTVNATTNSTLNTEDTFVELAQSGNQIKIKAVRVRLGGPGSALATTGVDNDFQVRLVRKTAGGATGTGGTETRKQQAAQTPGVTALVKNGTSAFTTATLGDVIDTVIKNGRETFEWIAKDEEDAIITHPTTASGNIFAVLVTSAVASQTCQVTVEWDE